jgi:hypothetical protein
MSAIAINRGLIAETGHIPDGLQFLRDTYNFNVIQKKNTVTEGINGSEVPIMVVTGLIQKGDTTNSNSRVYSTKDVLIPAVRSIQEDIKSRSVMGEYDHPNDAKIHLDRVSHLMTKIWMEGKEVYGQAEILHKQPCGAALRGLFEHKVRVGISSRGVGDMEVCESHGSRQYIVMPGYAFVTWDVVADPSVNGAILNIQESLNRKLRPIKESANKLGKRAYQAALVSEINRFFDLR